MTTTPTRTVRRLAGAAALVFGATTLGGCLELGNGDDPNCSEEVVESLLATEQGYIERLNELSQVEDDPETPLDEADLADAEAAFIEDVLFPGLNAKLDACDVSAPN